MNTEKQRLAIAEGCGWKWESGTALVHRKGDQCGYVIIEHGRIKSWFMFPDYIGDLNAMREVEKTVIAPPMVRKYATYLCTICERASPMVPVWHASAAQRAESFLRTIGKWEEA